MYLFPHHSVKNSPKKHWRKGAYGRIHGLYPSIKSEGYLILSSVDINIVMCRRLLTFSARNPSPKLGRIRYLLLLRLPEQVGRREELPIFCLSWVLYFVLLAADFFKVTVLSFFFLFLLLGATSAAPVSKFSSAHYHPVPPMLCHNGFPDCKTNTSFFFLSFWQWMGWGREAQAIQLPSKSSGSKEWLFPEPKNQGFK